jgi:hypothetical protein
MTELTIFEAALVAVLHRRYRSLGFPKPIDVQVTGRENLGFVAYVHLKHHAAFPHGDLTLALGNYSHVEFESAPDGAHVEAEIADGKLVRLSFKFYGDVEWDGDETGWRILDPEAGEGYLRYWS